MDVQTVTARYVFLDVVGFTSGRSVEAQSDIVAALNTIVQNALLEAKISQSDTILIPTGDGICVAIVGHQSPYDAHMELARHILRGVTAHRAGTRDKARRFDVRIGVNANIDNLVTDINDRPNVAGAGISTAQRLMDLAGANNVIVGPAVYEVLSTRERYMGAFQAYPVALKHRQQITAYLYSEAGVEGLSTDVPRSLKAPSEKPRKLSPLVACYAAEAIEHEGDILALNQGGSEEYCLIVLLAPRCFKWVIS